MKVGQTFIGFALGFEAMTRRSRTLGAAALHVGAQRARIRCGRESARTRFPESNLTHFPGEPTP